MTMPQDFVRQQVAAARAMEEFRLSLRVPMEAVGESLSLPGSILANVRMQAEMMAEISGRVPLTPTFAQVAGILSPALRATTAVSGLMQSMNPAFLRAMEMASVQALWRESMRPLPLTPILSHLAGVGRVAEAAALLAVVVPMHRPTTAFSAQYPAMRAEVEAMGGAYGDFYEGVGASGERLLELPPTATTGPATEYFNALDVLESAGEGEVEQEAADELQAARVQIAQANAEALNGALAERFPDLTLLLDGARAAFDAKHPDYQRHFITSLRELCTQMLHRLAPDDRLSSFSTNPNDFKDDRPTRNLRLRYICRGINDDRFGKFVEKDVGSAVALFELLQGGTHSVTCPYSDAQLQAILVRAQGLVQFLLEISVSA